MDQRLDKDIFFFEYDGVLLDVLVSLIKLRLDHAGRLGRGVALLLGLLQLLLEFVPTASTSERAADEAREAMAASEAAGKQAKAAAAEAEKSKEKAEELAYGLKVKLDKEKDAHRAEETAFQALEAKTKASEQRASDEGTATQGLRVKLEGMEADRAWPRRWRGG